MTKTTDHGGLSIPREEAEPEKRSPGRPRLPDGERRDQRVVLKYTPGEKASLHAKAREERTTLTELVLVKVLES